MQVPTPSVLNPIERKLVRTGEVLFLISCEHGRRIPDAGWKLRREVRAVSRVLALRGGSVRAGHGLFPDGSLGFRGSEPVGRRSCECMEGTGAA